MRHLDRTSLLLLIGYFAAVVSTGFYQVALPEGYDAGAAPSLALCDSKPTTVLAQMYVAKMHSVNERKETIELEGYFRLWWNDTRLSHSGGTCGAVDGASTTAVGREYASAKGIWTPDVYFGNALKNTLGGDQDRIEGEMLTLSPTGEVFWSQRARLQVDCPMNFWRMPWDVQHCKLELGLYRSRADRVTIEWKNEYKNGTGQPFGWVWGAAPLSAWQEIPLPAVNKLHVYSTGTFSSATAHVDLKRKDTALMYFAMVPSVLFVVAQYSGFFIHYGAAPARVALGFLCTLMLLNNLNAVRQQLPAGLSLMYEDRGSWMLAFMYGCMIFNILAFLEFPLVNYGQTAHAEIEKEEKEKKAKQVASSNSGVASGDVQLTGDGTSPSTATRAPGGQIKLVRQATRSLEAVDAKRNTLKRNAAKFRNMDRTCRWLFPLAFIIYVIAMTIVLHVNE